MAKVSRKHSSRFKGEMMFNKIINFFKNIFSKTGENDLVNQMMIMNTAYIYGKNYPKKVDNIVSLCDTILEADGDINGVIQDVKECILRDLSADDELIQMNLKLIFSEYKLNDSVSLKASIKAIETFRMGLIAGKNK